MKTVKIISDVIHSGKILKKDSTHRLSEEHAKILIDGEHAEEAEQGQQQRPGNEPRATLERMKRPALLKEVEIWNGEHPEKAIAVNDALSNAQVVELLLTAAGYKTQS